MNDERPPDNKFRPVEMSGLDWTRHWNLRYPEKDNFHPNEFVTMADLSQLIDSQLEVDSRRASDHPGHCIRRL